MARIYTVAKARKDQGSCEGCHQPITAGESYRWTKPKTGPYGGRKRRRHTTCGTWQPWDLSSALWARLAQVSHDAHEAFDSVESVEDVESVLSDAAEAIRQIAEEKRESASNIEDGFGHSTYQSDELNDVADQLDTWADEVESAEVPEFPETSECPECYEGRVDCDRCEGSGEVPACEADEPDPEAGHDDVATCPECVGDGQVDCSECEGSGEALEPTDEDIDAWRDEAREALNVLEEAPV